jgi:hypothetical protein
MELASVMQKLSFRKNPRNGQKRVLQEVIKGGGALNVQLPTGYGKTFTACAAYSILRDQGRANRLLYITPTTAQHQQFVSGGHEDLRDAGVPLPHKIKDVSFFKTTTLKEHRNNQCQVFAINVQALITKDGMDRVCSLMQQGQWMVVVDEYHHYGLDATWGKSVLALNSAYRLCMSATPGRKDDDSAFGKPDVIVRYDEAVKEAAVKPLCGHSYTYRIDAVTGDGDVVSYTTSELKEELGEGDQMERKRIERKMRWSPRYISPLVSIPIERMITQRLHVGYRLQAIVGAMCVSHAQMVCEQVQSMFPELCVEWVGTGVDGRAPEENEKILKRFCPPKNENGRRDPFREDGKWWVLIDGRREQYVDVLVHVGMAGEGLDSVLVSEVIHLNPASINNSNNQENGRAARYLPGVTGNINFDSCSEFARGGYIGPAIMSAMDLEPAQPCDKCGCLPCTCETAAASDREFEIPEEPMILLADMELIHIDSGSPEIKRVQKMLIEEPVFRGVGITRENYDTPENVQVAINMYRSLRHAEAKEFNERATVEQWKDHVNAAVSSLVGTLIKASHASGTTVIKSFAGDKKKMINRMKAQSCGPISDDVETCKRHYRWVHALQQSIMQEGVPVWLA